MFWIDAAMRVQALGREMTVMPMKNPVHPGRIARHDCLEPLGLSVTAGAKALGVTRQALSNIINGKTRISPEMAIRLSAQANRSSSNSA